MDRRILGNDNNDCPSLDGKVIIYGGHQSSSSVPCDHDGHSADGFHIGDYLIPAERIMRHVTPLVLNALRRIPCEVSKSFVICDYGAWNGLPSMCLMKSLIGALKDKCGVDQQVLIVYEDLPENDFTPLFNILAGQQGGPTSYLYGNPNVFVTGCGRSFYTQCLPNEHVNLGFCAMALQRLSKCPCSLPDAVFCSLSDCEQSVTSFAAQAADDYNRFLLCRAKELAPGGRMVLVVPHQFTELGLSRLWKTMMEDGKITAEEFRNTNADGYDWTVAELEKPFLCLSSAVFKAGLRLVEITAEIIPCPFQEAMCKAVKTGDHTAVRASVAQFIQYPRYWLASTFSEGLSSERPSAVKDHLVNELFSSFEDAVTADPTNYGTSKYFACVHIKKEKTG